MRTNNPPRFFIVGAPKCGTTALFNWLKEHYGIHAPRKEPGFFSRDIADNTHIPSHIANLSEYIALIGTPRGSELVGGEATPKYLYSDNAIKDISELRPDARIIVCLRDPVELAISLYNQKLREGVETASTFDEAWAASLAAMEAPNCDLPHERNYYLWACVGTRLQKLYKHFHSEAVCIILASELRSNPGDCYRKALAHIGVDDDGRSDFPSYNERAGIRNLPIHRGALALKRFADPLLRLVYRFRGKNGLGILKLINRFNVKPREYTATASSHLKRQMYSQLRDEIDLAESYLGGRTLVDRTKFFK